MKIKQLNKILIVGTFFAVLFACQNKSTEKPGGEELKSELQTIDSTLIKFGINDSDTINMGGLSIGQLAPDFNGETLGNTSFSLSETLKNQEVLLVFYRGYWCGYCQKHLADLEEHLQDFEDRGIKVVAITPESQEYAEKTVDKSNISIDIIPDRGYEIMKEYKVLFEVNDYYLEKLAGYEIDYDKDPETGKTFFPVPATYLVGKDGKIKFAHYDPDYSQRSDVEKLLGV